MPISRLTLGAPRAFGVRDELKVREWPSLVRSDASPKSQEPVPTPASPIPLGSAVPGHATKVLPRRVETVSGRAMDLPADAVSRLVAQQQRIDILEGLLQEFKVGLQDLMQESTRKSQLLQEADERRAALATVLADKSKQIADLEQRCDDLEKQAWQAPETDLSLLAFASRQVERLKRDEVASMATMKRAQQAREEAEQFLSLASGLSPRPEARVASRAALSAPAFQRLDRYAVADGNDRVS